MPNPPQISRITGWMIRKSECSWWQVRYDSGKVISEWETLQNAILFNPLANPSSSRWEDIPKLGIRGLYLLAPNGEAAALEANGENVFFQLKFGYGGGERQTVAHIIGQVEDDSGRCTCYAWEYDNKRLIRFVDNITHLVYRNIGPLSLGHHTGVR